MAAITITWDPTAPTDGDTLTSGNEAIQIVKTGVAQRVRNGGHSFDTTSGPTTTETDGRHCCGVALAAGSAAEATGTFNIYAADKTTVIATLSDSTATPASQFSVGAFKIVTTGNISGATGTFSGAVSTGALTTATLTASGNILPNATNTIDLGVTGTRFRNLWLSGTMEVTGVATFTAIPVFSAGVTFSSLAIFTSGATMNGTLAINDKQFGPVSPLSTTRAVASNERVIVATLTSDVTLTLPAVASANGRELWIALGALNLASRKVTIDGNASELIYFNNHTVGNLTFDLSSTSGIAAVHLICDGTAWYVLASHIF